MAKKRVLPREKTKPVPQSFKILSSYFFLISAFWIIFFLVYVLPEIYFQIASNLSILGFLVGVIVAAILSVFLIPGLIFLFVAVLLFKGKQYARKLTVISIIFMAFLFLIISRFFKMMEAILNEESVNLASVLLTKIITMSGTIFLLLHLAIVLYLYLNKGARAYFSR